jgi:signal transduction histidine kinase
VVRRTAYRIVREGLTNVRKHAPGAHVVVRVSYDAAQVRLSIRNSPAALPHASALAATGSGLGIAGLRQRVELMHGTLRATGAEDGGFCLEATMPSYVPTTQPAA